MFRKYNGSRLFEVGSAEGNAGMITLQTITKENIEEVIALKVREDQRGFVSSVAESLAQAYVYNETAYPFSVYEDDTLV